MTCARDDDARQMGHGVNRRAAVRMSGDEVAAFLDGRHTMTLSSFNHDGTIHAVAMWYGFLDGQIAFETKAKSQKARNILRDPRVTCMVCAGERYEELRGVELVGRAELVEEPSQTFALGVSVYERYHGPYRETLRPFVEAMLAKRIVARLAVARLVSWDHRKLGLAGGET